MTQHSNPKRIAILGSGGMGRLFGRLIADESQEIELLDRNTPKLFDKLADSDLIVVATPATSATDTATQLRRVAGIEDKPLVCLWSYMATGVSALEQLGGPVLYMHLLFGPDITSATGQNVVVAGATEDPSFRGVLGVFEDQGARVHRTKTEFHDSIMAYTQALSQASSIVLGASLAESGYSQEQLHDFASLTFRLNRYAIERIARQPAKLWAELQFENKDYPGVLQAYAKNLSELTEAVASHDEQRFEKLFEPVAKFWHSRPETVVKDAEFTPANDSKKRPTADLAALGPQGTYSAQAAHEYSARVELILAPTIRSVLSLVADGAAQRGVVPLENSIQGAVTETLDNLLHYDVVITDEIVLNIHHALCALERPERPELIQRIYSHPQALDQCRHYLSKHYPNAQLVPVASTAAGMELIADQKDLRALAVGPTFAATTYELIVIDRDIEDESDNQTRFVICQKRGAAAKPTDFTFVVAMPHADRPGLLHDILAVMNHHRVNLSQVESRPNRTRLGSYQFYMRLDLASDDPRLAKITQEAAAMDVTLRSLSS